MSNKYVSFVSDAHLIKCIANLHSAYVKSKRKFTKQEFYSNKVDVFKLIFDAKFNDLTEEKLIQAEILRQIDKTINNSIGTFHEDVLGGIDGYEQGYLSGYDIKAKDGSVFADIKNKHNTMNSSAAEALFQKLASLADTNKKAKCYWVQILAKKSFVELWKGDINGKEYSHSRVFKISGDKFYQLLTGEREALYNLYKALPVAIEDYLNSLSVDATKNENSAMSEISFVAKRSERTIIDQITLDNFKYYDGFEGLI